MVKSKAGGEVEHYIRSHPNFKAAYHPLNRQEKRDMRVWLYSKRVAVEEEKLEALRVLTQTETSSGTWYPLKRVSKELGDDEEAAVAYAKSCIAMGPSEYAADVQRS